MEVRDMKVLAINGSPRKGGNTEILLKAVLAPIEAAGIETELVQIGGHLVHGCSGCRSCRESGVPVCKFKDDIINDVIAKMIEADGIVIGSPTYFADVTAETKALIDRAGFCTLGRRLLRHKVGVGISAVRRGGAVHAVDSINHFFMISEVVIPGSTYWNFGIGGAVGDVQSDAEGLRNMNNLGENMAWLVKLIASEKL
jgi:multimeric flavodoxin WrbA